MQIDVGFGDAVTSTPALVDYPTLLDLPAPKLRGYHRETVVAEKFEAIVHLGAVNSRMKDFFDLWLLSRRFDFDGLSLAAQVQATFERRGTKMDAQPVGLSPSFTTPAQRLWEAFLRKGGVDGVPHQLDEVTEVLGTFLRPLAEACAESTAFTRRWVAPGPWI